MKFLSCLFLLYLSAACSGCASPSSRNPRNLVRAWSNKLSYSERFHYPFLAVFQLEKKRLYYVASNHETQINGKSLQLIKTTMAEVQPDVVLLEGFETDLGLSPSKMKHAARADGKGGFYKWGETTFAIQESLRRNVPFIGGEPPESEVTKAIILKGYDLSDLLYFYFVRQIPQMQRADELQHKSVEIAFYEFLERMTAENILPTSQVRTFDMFKSWYKEKNKEEFMLSKVDSETTAPFENGQFFTQRLSAAVGRVRDEFMVDEIFRLLDQYDRVLVIYGGSHFTTQRLALEAELGKALIKSGNTKNLND